MSPGDLSAMRHPRVVKGLYLKWLGVAPPALFNDEERHGIRVKYALSAYRKAGGLLA